HQSVVSKQGAWRLDLFSCLRQSPVLSQHPVDDSSVQNLLPDQLAGDHAYDDHLPQHQTPELGSLSAADGQTLHYRLTRPDNTVGQIPVIVSVYGGPGVQRVRNEWAPLSLQLLVRAGFAVFELDNRGSGGRGREFEESIYKALGTVEVADQLIGVEYLKTLDWVDPSAIGVFGHSYGGFMTLKCLLAAPEVFAAGVSVAPVTDWTLYDTHYTERYLGLPQAEADAYARSGVLGHCAGLAKPLLLMHGMADDNVLFANTTALLAELQAELVPFSLMTYPGSKHALQEPHVATHRYDMILAFFRQHLLK
ncbi:MAG: alpha/beta hydrolase family protein, partial [Pseudomonadales bacterium]